MRFVVIVESRSRGGRPRLGNRARRRRRTGDRRECLFEHRGTMMIWVCRGRYWALKPQARMVSQYAAIKLMAMAPPGMKACR